MNLSSARRPHWTSARPLRAFDDGIPARDPARRDAAALYPCPKGRRRARHPNVGQGSRCQTSEFAESLGLLLFLKLVERVYARPTRQPLYYRYCMNLTHSSRPSAVKQTHDNTTEREQDLVTATIARRANCVMQ